MQWRTYRIKEFINIIKCFRCHGYGHIAKYCSNVDQLYEFCDCKEHLKKDCDRKENPICQNCRKTRRKECNHNVRSKMCPEYIKQVGIYKIDWT